MTSAAPSIAKKRLPEPFLALVVALVVLALAAAAGAAPDAPVPVPEPDEKAMRYYRSGNVLWVAGTAWGLVIPALFLFTGFSARIRDWAAAVGRRWFFVIAVYFLLFSVILFVVDLPLSYYAGYVREHAYGLSNQSAGAWLGDQLKGLLVGMIVGVLFLWIPYLILRRSPRRWWLYCGLAAIPFMFFVMLITPIWISPIFDKFGPMKDKALEARILDLADRAGIDADRVFEVDKSKDTETVNAYVTGFLGTKRIVLWDTLVAKFDDGEVLFVMGHEMGHYVLRHVIIGVLFFSLLVMASLYAVHRASAVLIARFKDRFGFDRLSDVGSLPLLMLLFGACMLVVAPVVNGVSRMMEHEADRFGLEITQNNRDAATAFVKLQKENLGNPRPGLLYKLWRSLHPTLGDRIDFANAYRPWEAGAPLRYGHLFAATAGTPTGDGAGGGG